MTRRNAMLLTLSVVLFAIAGVVYYKFTRAEEVGGVALRPMDDLVCTACGHCYQMTPEDAKAAFENAPRTEVREGEMLPRHIAKRRPRLLTCPQCGKRTVVPGARCTVDDLIYPVALPDGTDGRCPKQAGHPRR